LLYANVPIYGSPFTVEVVDPSAVQLVGHIPECFVVGKPALFKGHIICCGIGLANICTAFSIQLNTISLDMFFFCILASLKMLKSTY